MHNHHPRLLPLIFLLSCPHLIQSAPQTSDIDIDISQQSGSNPSCSDPAFLHLSCPSPGLCYYSDRSGTPACCPAGQNCQSGSGSWSSESPPPASAPPASSSGGGSGGGSSSSENSGNSDSSKDAGAPVTGGGSYVGPGAENVVVLMNNSSHARGLWDGGSGVGRLALRVVWGWVFLLNVLGL